MRTIDIFGGFIAVAILAIILAVMTITVMPPTEANAGLNNAPKYLLVNGDFVRFDLANFTPGSVAQTDLEIGTVLEVFISNSNQQFPEDFGNEGLINPDSPALVEITGHRVVTVAQRESSGRFTRVAQYEGTSPFIRRLPQDLGGNPINEYFIAEIISMP